MQIYNIYNGSGVIYSVTKTNTSFFCPSGRDFPIGIKYMIYRRFKKLIFKSTQKNWFTYRKYLICYPTQKPCLRIFDVPKHTKSCLEKEVGIN